MTNQFDNIALLSRIIKHLTSEFESLGETKEDIAVADTIGKAIFLLNKKKEELTKSVAEKVLIEAIANEFEILNLEKVDIMPYAEEAALAILSKFNVILKD